MCTHTQQMCSALLLAYLWVSAGHSARDDHHSSVACGLGFARLCITQSWRFVRSFLKCLQFLFDVSLSYLQCTSWEEQKTCEEQKWREEMKKDEMMMNRKDEKVQIRECWHLKRNENKGDFAEWNCWTKNNSKNNSRRNAKRTNVRM